MYKHLKPWLKGGKFLYVFSWSNLGGAAIGCFVADHLVGLVPLIPPQLVYIAGILAGIGATWPVQGRPAYELAWIWCGWATRRLLAPSTLEARSADYFPVAAPTTGRSLTLDGTLTVPQTRAGSANGLPAVELLPALPAPTSVPAAEIIPGASLAVTVPVALVTVGRTNGTGSHEREEN